MSLSRPSAEKHGKNEKNPTGRQSPDLGRPNMSDLRIVLLGKNLFKNIRVRNLILGTNVKETKLPSDDLMNSSVIIRGMVENRNISLIRCSSLFQPNLTQHQITERVKDCVRVSAPGPHVFILILQQSDFSKEDKHRVMDVLNCFSDQAIKRTIVLTTDENIHRFVRNNELNKLINECGGGHLQFNERQPGWCSEMLRRIDDVLEKKPEEYLKCDIYEDAKAEGSSVDPLPELTKHEDSVRSKEDKFHPKDDVKPKERDEKNKHGGGLFYIKDEQADLKHLRIVLIGKTGNGKSATGNTILGRKLFDSQSSSDSVMTVCEKGVCEVDGRSVAVVDTPGLSDTKTRNDKLVEEIMKCVLLSAPGPHAFIIMLSVGRFTQEDSETIDLIKKTFGPKVSQFSIVLFTRGDDLEGESIEDYVKRSNSAELKKLIRDCGDRYLAFNNKETQDRTQVMKLIKMIEEMKTTNHVQYFTNSMFEEAEMSIKKRMEEILKEKEREIQEQKEELKARHEIEMKSMMKRLEEEKRKADEERVQMESKFKEQETLRKEFEDKKRQMREDDERKRRERHEEQLREKQEELEKTRKKLEKERDEERQQREGKEREYEEKKNEKKRHYEKLDQEIKEEWERKKREDDERREEERKRWEKRMEDIKKAFF